MKKLLFLFIMGTFSISLCGQYKQASGKELDTLKTKLETLFMHDQLFRRLYQDAEKKFGQDSAEMEYFWKVVEDQDKRIESELIKILDKYGWLGISDVGRLANGAIWSIIQHSSLKTKEKYAALMKASVLKKESQPLQYARLIDRMLVNAHKPQIYGSQTTKDKNENVIFFEIEKPEYVDLRRREIGLEGIEGFAKEKGIDWTISQKKK
ncbi:hypothetical protein MWU65_12925 [Cellulophaga sp. F20128]|uniref:DUF6624 domain-containing protein n=1 Tax=Cellulophaga sp. F20128 TaxID=2926413 RepID=UPI001FF64456|nr:DUF6624 domain-containing protein [Cellulophaga sp. F20128]MCK0158092.1 hypothetical protein [Cellulophaga sp. F20128]